MSNTLEVRGSLNSNNLIYSNSVSANTISASTFFGNLNASYVGNNDVNNTEFGYVSGVTSNIQEQLNSIPDASLPLLTYSSSTLLTNDRVITAGENIILQDDGNNLSMSMDIGVLDVNEITVTPLSAQTDYNPTGWNSTYPNKSTVITLTPSAATIISGFEGGEEGRVLIVRNLGRFLVILEHLSSKNSSSSNRMSFARNGGCFLVPWKTVTLIYNSTTSLWEESTETEGPYNDFSIFTDFANAPLSLQIVGGGGFSPFGGFAFYNKGGTTQIIQTGDTDSFGAVFFGGATNVSQYFSWGQGRNVGSANQLNATRLKLLNIPTATSDYKFLTGTDGNYISGSFEGVSQGAKWKVDRTVSPTNWVIQYATGQTSNVVFTTNVPLITSAYTIVGHYQQATSVAGNNRNACFFYSYDDKDYSIERQILTGFIIGSLNNIMNVSMTGGAQAATNLRGVIIDWVGLTFYNDNV